MIAANREPDKKHGKAVMQAVIDSVASGVPATLTEIRKLGRTLKPKLRAPSASGGGCPAIMT
jgi:hypothetical protein